MPRIELHRMLQLQYALVRSCSQIGPEPDPLSKWRQDEGLAANKITMRTEFLSLGYTIGFLGGRGGGPEGGVVKLSNKT